MKPAKSKTLDGARTRVQDLNTGVPFARKVELDGVGMPETLRARLSRLYKNLSLVMAGMYTGLNCYGTPHCHRVERAADESNNKPDNRPL
jgi:hypothetical protein